MLHHIDFDVRVLTISRSCLTIQHLFETVDPWDIPLRTVLCYDRSMNDHGQKNFSDSDTFFEDGLVIASPILDVEWLEMYARGWEVQVRQGRKNDRLRFSLRAVHTPNIQIGKNRYTSALLSKGSIPKGCIVLVYVQTPGIVNYRNEKYRPDQLIFVTPDDEIDMVISMENVAYSIAVEERLFTETFFAHYGRSFEEVITNRRFKLHNRATGAFLRFVHHWLDFFQHRDMINIDLISLEQEFLHKLFGFFELKHPEKNRSGTTLLKRARELLHDNLDMYLKMNEVSEMLGVSQRTLEHTFRQNFGMTPKNYLQILRLHAAREELLRADSSSTKVSDIAIKYAFFHMSHFAAEYRKLFGETPAQSLRR